MLENLALLAPALSKRTVREQITDRLAGMVRGGLLRPGDALPGERELAAQLAVSRETVRGAIQALAALGLVEVAQGARSRIAPRARWAPLGRGQPRYSPAEVQGVRLLLEAEAAREAARGATAAQRARMRALLAAQGAALDDPGAFHVAGAEFHAVLRAAAGNRLLAALIGEAYAHSSELSTRALSGPGAMERSWQDHRRILAAIEARDGAAAAAAMQAHLSRLGRAARR